MKSIAYIDTSVILRHLLREPLPVVSLDNFQELITSELTDIECRRTLDRIRVQELIPDHEVALRYSELSSLLSAFRVVRLSSQVLKQARGTFPTAVRTLDALHICTALLAKEATMADTPLSFFFITHDEQQKTAAKSMGFYTV